MRGISWRKRAQFGYRAAGLTLIPLLSCLLLMAIYQYTSPNFDAPQARQGVLDLSGWDFGTKSFLNLDGEWEFYPGRLLFPEDFQNGDAQSPPSYAVIPGALPGHIRNKGGGRRFGQLADPEDGRIVRLFACLSESPCGQVAAGRSPLEGSRRGPWHA